MTSLQDRYQETATKHAAFCERGLCTDISRGKPSPEQLNLSQELLSLPGDIDTVTANGFDARNYGGDLAGLLELRSIFAPSMGVEVDQLVAGGNSSLSMMHDCLVWAMLRGVPDGLGPWCRQEQISFLCPAPGYELHFQMCKSYGIALRPIPVTADRPDLDLVTEAVKDPAVKGMWCVPTHANPTQEIFSDETVDRLASMHTAASDFRLFWDEAYLLHHFSADQSPAKRILPVAEASGNPNRPLMFSSTSKITHAGSGVGFLAASATNIEWYVRCRSARGPVEDKINQLRHAVLLKSPEHVRNLMERHSALLTPKFKVIDAALQRVLADGDAQWSSPKGGYFINVCARPGTAKRAISLAEKAGIKLTAAGSTMPGGHDPDDTYIRIAPSFADVKDIEIAAEIIAVSILLAEIEAKLAQDSSKHAEAMLQ